MAAEDVGVDSAPERPRLSADHAVQSDLRRRLESSFPLDALLPELHARNVLTDDEFTQLLPTPQSAVVDRNRKFLDYLANKGSSSVSDTLSVLFRHQYEAYGYFGEMLREVFGAEGEEGEGMRGKTSRKPQQGGERVSGAKESTSPPPGALGPPPPSGAAAMQRMSPWNHQALVSLRADLKLRVLMETGLGDKLEKAAGGFMDELEAKTVREQPGSIKQMDKAIDILLSKADKDFTTFLKMLQDSNNKVWAEELEKKAEQFREEGGECASTLLEVGRGGCETTTREGIELRSLRSKGEGPARTTPDKSLRAKLGCYYNKACIQDNPLLASSTMQYVKLNLVQPEQRRPMEGRVGEAVAVHLAKGGVQQVPHEKVPLEYQNILAFTPPASISRKRVLIEGVAGSGKSTLAQRICHDWSVDCYAQDYNIIHVALRSLPKDQHELTLHDLIFTSVGEADIVEEVAASITSCQGQAVLFIFDGFDELSEEMRESSLVRDIIKGRILPLSSFVVTTRPISAGSLYHCVDRRVEISGFGEEEVKKYITEYFASSNPSAGEKLLLTLSLRPHIERLCYVPLLLLMVCYIVSLDGDSAELPRTLHQLFEYLIILTLNHNLERTGRKERASSLRDVSQLCPSFDKLTQLALEGIEKDTIIFSNLAFEVDSAFLGLFNCIATRNRFGVVSRTWHFLHLAVQEYMAALAVAKKTPEEQVTFWKQHLTMKYNKEGEFVLTQDRYHTMFLFYSGLTGLSTPGIQSMLLDTIDTIVKPHIGWGTPLPELIAVVAESGNVQLARSILSPRGPTVEIDRGYLENVDVAWCVSEYCKQVEGAGIRIEGRYGVANFLSQLGDISTLGKVEVPEFGYLDVSDLPTVRQFLLKQTQLKCVMFGKLKDTKKNMIDTDTDSDTDSDTDTKKDVIDPVKDVLTHHKESLEEVTLHGETYWRVPLDPLVDSLMACQRLTSLELRWVTLSLQSLLAVVKGLHNLRALELEKVSLSDERSLTASDVHLIASSVEHHPSLRELTVGECSEFLAKGAVEGMARRHGVEKLVVTPYVVTPHGLEAVDPALVPPICAVMRAGSLKTWALVDPSNQTK